MGMLKVPFYERKGDVMGADGYLGYKYKHGVRYQFRYGDYVKMGVVGARMPVSLLDLVRTVWVMIFIPFIYS